MQTVSAAEIRIAVASNFSKTMKALVHRYETNTEHTVSISIASTGKHYAQIQNGAPFDLFFAADTQRPSLLEQEGKIIPGSRFTYAIGRLILWSSQAGFVDQDGAVLHQYPIKHLAIANPKLAPYGIAAQETLTSLKLWQQHHKRLVRAENINQAFHYINSGNAELGFVAYSQLKHLNATSETIPGSFWVIPETLYQPIEQQVVLLKENPTAHDFLQFIQSQQASRIIQDYGYYLP